MADVDRKISEFDPLPSDLQSGDLLTVVRSDENYNVDWSAVVVLLATKAQLDAHTGNVSNPHQTSVDNLTDTSIVAPDADDVLTWNGSAWVAQAVVSGAGNMLAPLASVQVGELYSAANVSGIQTQGTGVLIADVARLSIANTFTEDIAVHQALSAQFIAKHDNAGADLKTAVLSSQGGARGLVTTTDAGVLRDVLIQITAADVITVGTVGRHLTLTGDQTTFDAASGVAIGIPAGGHAGSGSLNAEALKVDNVDVSVVGHNHDGDYDPLGSAAAVQANLDTHTGSVDIHFSDAPADGQPYARNNNAWEIVSVASPLTTKGDLWGFTTVDARIPVGANGTILTANSAAPAGVEWTAPGGGGDVSQAGTGADAQIATWFSWGGKQVEGAGFGVSDLARLSQSNVFTGATQTVQPATGDATLAILPQSNGKSVVNMFGHTGSADFNLWPQSQLLSEAHRFRFGAGHDVGNNRGYITIRADNDDGTSKRQLARFDHTGQTTLLRGTALADATDALKMMVGGGARFAPAAGNGAVAVSVESQDDAASHVLISEANLAGFRQVGLVSGSNIRGLQLLDDAGAFQNRLIWQAASGAVIVGDDALATVLNGNGAITRTGGAQMLENQRTADLTVGYTASAGTAVPASWTPDFTAASVFQTGASCTVNVPSNDGGAPVFVPAGATIDVSALTEFGTQPAGACVAYVTKDALGSFWLWPE